MQHRSEHAGEWTVAVSVNILNLFLRMTALLVNLEYVQLNFFSPTNSFIPCMVIGRLGGR